MSYPPFRLWRVAVRENVGAGAFDGLYPCSSDVSPEECWRLALAEANCAQNEKHNDHEADNINDIIHEFSISVKPGKIISVADVSGMVIATTNMDQSG